MPRRKQNRPTKRQLAELRRDLEAEERLIVATAQASIQSAMARDTLTGDEADEADDELERSDEMLLRDRERTKLRKIRKALARMDNGTYAECEECGEPIGYERLKARPVATLCIRCKQEQERRERVTAEARDLYRTAG